VNLTEFFDAHPKVALAYSGGCDSTFLLAEALRCGVDVRPYLIQSVFQPRFEQADALRYARDLGVAVTQIELDILADADVAANPADRCYRCKKTLFGHLIQRAEQDGYTTIIDGTNASDDAADRPGMRALAELGVLSPLRLCGLTKAEVRRQSQALGLPTWNKPAYACLATRIPTGRLITAAMLDRVEKAEEVLFEMGFSDFRVRVLAEAARLQLPADQMEQALAQRETIRNRLSPYFQTVLLDLAER
jgi:pyridinium-3,5-biscarboxylic acid mononucleotide sulfurtransferase